MSLREAEELSGLVGQIYDAALAPALWPDVLANTARFVGGRSAALYAKNEPDMATSSAPKTICARVRITD
jgi:hypothetical protein